MESCYEEEEVCKCRRPILIIVKICAGDIGCFPQTCFFAEYFHDRGRVCADDKVCPFPCLAAEEGDASEERPQHPFLNGCAVHAVASFHREHHGNGAHNEDEGHETNEYKGKRYAVEKRDG